jgi:hypothetical protein
LGAAQSFVFSANLVTTGSPSSCVRVAEGDSSTVMELQFFTFSHARNISVSDNTTAANVVSFSASPALAKFTLRLFSWPWLNNAITTTSSNDDRLEVRIDIAPAFTTATQLASTAAYVETFELSGQQSTSQPTDGRPQFSTVVHLLKAVKLDGMLLVMGNNHSADERGAVEFRIDEESSQLVLSFAHFNSSLEYDPGKTTPLLFSPVFPTNKHVLTSNQFPHHSRCGSAGGQCRRDLGQQRRQQPAAHCGDSGGGASGRWAGGGGRSERGCAEVAEA